MIAALAKPHRVGAMLVAVSGRVSGQLGALTVAGNEKPDGPDPDAVIARPARITTATPACAPPRGERAAVRLTESERAMVVRNRRDLVERN